MSTQSFIDSFTKCIKPCDIKRLVRALILGVFLGFLWGPCGVIQAQETETIEWENSTVFRSISAASKARSNGTPIFRLDLSKQKLKAIPAEISEWTELREIILDRNRIKTLGPELEQFIFLERLSANYNQIESFPMVLTRMDHIVTLELGDNMIDSIPLNIDNMRALKSLELWANVLEYFPASLSDLQNLGKLDLLHNDMVFEEQEALRSWLSQEVELILSAPCRCEFKE